MIGLLIGLAVSFAVWLAVVLLSDRWRRWVDLRVLWPSFKANSPNLEAARLGFIVHMSMDPSWQQHCCGWTEEEFGDFVRSRLT